MQKCLSQHRRWRIERLGDVYSVVSVAHVASLLGLTGSDAEQIVLDDLRAISARQILNSGQSSATLLDRPDHPLTIQFSSLTGPGAGQTFNTQESAQMLNDKIREAKHWQTLVEDRDRQLGRSTTYLTRVSTCLRLLVPLLAMSN